MECTFLFDKKGVLWCMGSNEKGKLSVECTSKDNTLVESLTKVVLSTTFLDVCSGDCFSIGLDINGLVWGSGKFSDTKHNSVFTQNVFSELPEFPEITQISCSPRGNHFLVLDIDGNVWSKGSNLKYQLGRPTTYDELWREYTVGMIPDLPCVRKIAAGTDHNHVETVNGELYCFGFRGGRKERTVLVTLPSGMAEGTLRCLVAGHRATVAIDYEGNLWRFDCEENGPFVKYECPEMVSASVGGGHFLALDVDGNVWSEGVNNEGQLGFPPPDNFDYFPLRKIEEYSDIISVHAHWDHSVLVSSDGTVFLFGSDDSKQLGRRHPDNSLDFQSRISTNNNGRPTWKKKPLE